MICTNYDIRFVKQVPVNHMPFAFLRNPTPNETMRFRLKQQQRSKITAIVISISNIQVPIVVSLLLRMIVYTTSDPVGSRNPFVVDALCHLEERIQDMATVSIHNLFQTEDEKTLSPNGIVDRYTTETV